MNIDPAKAAAPLGKLVPNPKAKLREQFHEVMRGGRQTAGNIHRLSAESRYDCNHFFGLS